MCTREEAEFITRCVLTEATRGVDPATGTGHGVAAEEDWCKTFREVVVPAIEQGSKYISDKHPVDIIGYAKIFTDDFSKDTFDSIAFHATIGDSPSNLNWGRIISLFTFMRHTREDLVAKHRHDDITTLQQWLVDFLNRRDISDWIANTGGWITISSKGTSTAGGQNSWWSSILSAMKNIFSNRDGVSEDLRSRLERLEREMELLKQNHRDLEPQNEVANHQVLPDAQTEQVDQSDEATDSPSPGPDLPQLIRLNVPRDVGRHFKQFGTFLLEDKNGAKVSNIAHAQEHHGECEAIVTAILERWLAGGDTPVTWRRLIKTLRDCELKVLAQAVESRPQQLKLFQVVSS